ncbi:TatD family hydrolase [endosymbiont of Lamellibrachia barhami]|uniref:TatD family hydrolase n=1 Tax=endosymbiont of Lamellibrachia barhami TaxID=205975 RepID=UPI0015AABE6F|nr:TatD family hydrolase [endosymbiont of Lamellibrachia barhami]
MLVDSHCHLDRVDLEAYDNDFKRLVQTTLDSGVQHLLCVSIDLESWPDMVSLVEPYPEISLSVGVHPNDKDRHEPTVDELVKLAQTSRVVAIGETGLDYFRSEGDLTWQQSRFRHHIQASKACGKPLIIHTRAAKADTIRIMQEEGADQAGGVMHCFTEDLQMAEQALEMGFYISFSGIITFRNAADLRDVASKVPLERLLVETDSPYLAPVPHRGKSNQPLYVARVAECIAELRGISVDSLARQTTANFYRCFPEAVR